MARSQEEARYGDLPPWSYCEQPEASTTSSYGGQHPNNLFRGDAFPCSYTAPGAILPDGAADDRYIDPSRIPGYQNYTLLDMNNARVVGKVMYDEKLQRRFVMPVDSQYELFDRAPLSPGLSSGSFPSTSEFSPRAPPHHYAHVDGTTSNFIKDVLGNWEPNGSGTYSPFGQNYPLNHPSPAAPEPPIADISANATDEAKLVSSQKNVNSPRRVEIVPLAETNRKRIVAEVKPMRPSYSDVLAKNNKNPTIDTVKKVKAQVTGEVKNQSVKNGSGKVLPPASKQADETKHKTEKSKSNVRNPPSSGSDSGDFNFEENKTLKHGKGKNSTITSSWSSLHNGNQDDNIRESTSDFVFIESQQDKATKKGKKEKKDKNVDTEEEASLNNGDHSPVRDNGTESNKAKKKVKDRNSNNLKSSKAAEKKKTVSKNKRSKAGGYLGIAQAYIEQWSSATFKAVMWFWNLLSDICHMSAALLFDLLTSVFTQTYVSWQAVYRGAHEKISRLRNNRWLQYVDRKLGDTPLGFWRNIKWFKKAKEQLEPESSKTSGNIPLPATGEEAMKRLLACKGKDPYSILGVTPGCTDEEIRRYYRRQAFLVHPDKNQQPGAEEAFKILQHAFDLIGEPERRSAFDRRTLEHQHVEAAWSELSTLLAQLHDKMERAANTIRCTNCGRRHKRVITDRPCYAARYCAQCKIRHSAKEGDIWAESGLWGLLVMYYACMDGGVYQITQWASCQKKNLKQLKPNCHVVQYRIVLGNKAGATPNLNQRPSTGGADPNLEEFLNNLYGAGRGAAPPPHADAEAKRRRNKKTKT